VVGLVRPGHPGRAPRAVLLAVGEVGVEREGEPAMEPLQRDRLGLDHDELERRRRRGIGLARSDMRRPRAGRARRLRAARGSGEAAAAFARPGRVSGRRCGLLGILGGEPLQLLPEAAQPAGERERAVPLGERGAHLASPVGLEGRRLRLQRRHLGVEGQRLVEEAAHPPLGAEHAEGRQRRGPSGERARARAAPTRGRGHAASTRGPGHARSREPSPRGGRGPRAPRCRSPTARSRSTAPA